jgi:hypothetical protein
MSGFHYTDGRGGKQILGLVERQKACQKTERSIKAISRRVKS